MAKTRQIYGPSAHYECVSTCLKLDQSSYYQLDFLTPGISPRFASSRKQIRHRPKARMYPRFRPHRQQRCTIRDENFGFFFDLAI